MLDGGSVFAGYAGKRVSASHRVIAHGGFLGGGTSGGFLLGLFLSQETVFLVGAENLVLIVYVLHITLVGIEVPGTDSQQAVTERTGLKINEPGRIEGGASVAGLKVQVRAGRTAGGAAQADDIAGTHPVSRFHIALGQMAVEGLQSIGMTDHHQIAVTAHIVRDAHTAVEGRGNGRSGGIREVDTLVPAAVTVTVLGARFHHVGAHIGIQSVHYPKGETVRNGVRLFFIGVHGAGVPVLRKSTVGRHHAGVFHKPVGAVVVQHHLHGGIARV